MNIKMITSSNIAIAIIILLALNIFSNFALTSARMDMTDNNLFTLSKGTRNILDNLKEPVTVRLYVSQKLATRLPGISSYVNRVKELVHEYKRDSHGKINLMIIDPEPFTETEDEAVSYGLKGAPLNNGDNNFYFGLVATGSTDEQQVIPFFSPDRQEFAEYDITKVIQQVANPKKKVVGLMSTLSIDGSPAPHMPGMSMMQRPTETWTVVAQMRNFFEVKSLDVDITKIPDDIDVLMIVHPKNFSDATLYAIDQYILNGGHMLVFVDPNAETDPINSQQSGMPGNNFSSSNLNKLFKPWGISTSSDKIVGDIQLAQKVAFSAGQRNAAVDYPIWMKLTKQQMDSEDIITSDLGTINVATPGRITVTPTKGVNVTTLLQTTDKATEIEKTQLSFLTDPRDLLRNYHPGGSVYPLAVRVTGKVKSAFPDGAPKPADSKDTDKDKKDESKPLTESKDNINVIVFADTDMLEDRFWVRVQNMFGSQIVVPIAANGNLVINALDNLMGSDDLISVRNRGHFSRPFTRIDDIRQSAELKYREKEQQLMSRLQETERKLVELQRGKNQDQALILDANQKAELEQFQTERIKIRKELRQVRHQLQQDIDSLEAWLKFVNIGLIPMLIGIGGFAFFIISFRKRNMANRTSTANT